MRIVAETSKDDLKITVYNWNNKYILKFELGSYEQTYKLSALDITGDQEILDLLKDEVFVQEIRTKFSQMDILLYGALSRN